MLKIIKGLKPAVDNGISITTYVDDRGDEYVRVMTESEDFCIAANDCAKYDSSEIDAFKNMFTWDEAMQMLEANGLMLPTKEQAHLYINHCNEINNRLKDIGGDVLEDDWYWTSTKADYRDAWYYTSHKNYLGQCVKSVPCRVRHVINL